MGEAAELLALGDAIEFIRPLAMGDTTELKRPLTKGKARGARRAGSINTSVEG